MFRRCALVVAFALTSAMASAEALPSFGEVGGKVNPRWTPFSFAKVDATTRYAIEADRERGAVLHAVSEAGASALRFKIERAAEPTTKLSWHWKIGEIPYGSNAKRKATDDYAARVYVLFAYDPTLASAFDRLQAGLARSMYGEYPPHTVLCYIVEPNLPVGTFIDSPYTPKVKKVIVDNGKQLNTWLSFSRNVYDDYVKAFGAAPPTKMSGIVVMSDSDNTLTRAEAWYAGIALSF